MGVLFSEPLVSPKEALRRKAGQLKLFVERRWGEYVPRAYRTVLRIPESDQTRYLIVVAHARSGSSLLVHLLHANAQIFGIGEHHVSYDEVSDLKRLLNRSRFLARDPRMEPQWVMDKIVWQHHRVSDAVLGDPRVHLLFLVREPQTTFPSLGRVLPGCKTPESQLEYYRTRLLQMVSIAERLGDASRMTFVDYADLVGEPERTLAALSRDLDLAEPLGSNYGLTSKTGHMGWGDPGDAIRSGKIVKLSRDTVPLPPNVEEEAMRVYKETVGRFLELTAAG